MIKEFDYLTNDAFDKYIEENQVVLVDFYADWCGPCKMVDPVLVKISEQFGDKIKIAKVNVDTEPELASSFHIRSIPTVLIFRDSAIVESWAGVKPPSYVIETVEKWVNKV